ncbi:integrase domain-containing protein [Vibrio sp. 1CM24A]|uniref:integrase domain-containing protein n=1 Tax=Vibrio sp. 1CM24A TaxID=2929165 RepID=UPI0020BFD1D7|nr:integrase domain-containing protein [Vibrio sp. 1CM24A]MCK8083544.1 integrase domain-containing protein [Vibrio sp. 1CM24A]CAK1869339.1 Integrase [Vibrio crassostreae]
MKKQYQPTQRNERANPNSKNCGLRSKDINSAAKNALKEKFYAGQIGYATMTDQHNRFKQFSEFINEKFSVTDLRGVTREHIERFAESLNEKIDKDGKSASSAQNILSAVNTVMSQAIGSNALQVSARDCCLPSRSGIAIENKAISESQHHQIASQLPERLAALSEIQRALGLRFEESCKGNSQKMLSDALNRQIVIVELGTKGGQSRTVQITSQKQIDALQQTASIQGSHHSMIPSHMTYSQFQSAAYKEYAQSNYRPHSERHAYAQNSYSKHLEAITKISGLRCPVETGIKHGAQHHQYLSKKIGCSVKQAKEFDHQARIYVAEELGHHRINITNAYLG